MRALILHGPNDLRLEEIPDPTPGPGEVVLRTERAMTCATDAKILRNGRHPALPPVPAPFGHEVTGEVVAVGDGVSWPPIGMAVVVANSAPCGICRSCLRGRVSLCDDLTYLWGTFAQYVRIPARIAAVNMIERPAGLGPDLAPLIEPLACAINGVSRSAAAPGDEVVILGGGVQGQFLTACLAARGCRVTLCDPHESRRQRARRFGAAATLDAPRDGAGVGAVRDSLGGLGADIVFEAIGRPETWQIAVDVAGRGAEVNLYGGCPMGSTVTFPTEPLHYHELRLQGTYHHTPDAVRAALAFLLEASVPFTELVGEPIELADVAQVLATSGPKRPVNV
jgi:L-iditol 2-dehydrogenase